MTIMVKTISVNSGDSNDDSCRYDQSERFEETTSITKPHRSRNHIDQETTSIKKPHRSRNHIYQETTSIKLTVVTIRPAINNNV